MLSPNKLPIPRIDSKYSASLARTRAEPTFPGTSSTTAGKVTSASIGTSIGSKTGCFAELSSQSISKTSHRTIETALRYEL